MAVPILAFLATMGARYGASKAIQMAITKFGKKAFQKVITKVSFTGKEAAKKAKTYKDTKVHKETLKIRTRLGMTDKYAPIKELTKKVTKTKPIQKLSKKTKKILKVVAIGYGGVTGGLTGAAYEKGKKYKKFKKATTKKKP